MKKTLCLVLLSSYLFGGSGTDCYGFLEKGDENLQKIQTERYLDLKGYYSNVAVAYYKRYDICMKYENDKVPKFKESIKNNN